MLYAKVSDPLLRQDYYHGTAALDPTSANLPTQDLGLSHQDTLRQLVKELKSCISFLPAQTGESGCVQLRY